MKKGAGESASLYVHVPFCAGGKCDYCDFYSVPVKSGDGRLVIFVDTLLCEAERLFRAYRPEKIPSLYIGGGTPSVLGAAGIKRLLAGLLQLITSVSPPPLEITVEVNPESTDESFLAAAAEGGASRLSLGVQTFYGPSRRAVHRAGTEPCSGETLLHERLSLAAGYFPGAFSADLLSGLPFQNEKILSDDISALLSHKPAHVSLYALTEEPGTELAIKKAAGSLTLPEGDEADGLWLCGRDKLEKAGYSQYEVSNFCLPEKESLHNIRYWRMQNWLALGPAASGTIIYNISGSDETASACRYTIPPDVGAWLSLGGCSFCPEQIAGPVPAYAPLWEEIDTPTLIKETLLMGFRYIKGPDEALFRSRFRKGIEDLIPNTLGTWQDRSLLRREKHALTKEGLLMLNRFLTGAFGELDDSSSA